MSGGVSLINTKPNDESAELKGMFLASLRGTLVAVGLTVLLAIIMTAVALMTKDPDSIIGIFAYAALVIASLLGGITSIKADTEQRLGASLLSGVGYVLIIWLLSLFFRADTLEPVSPLWAIIGYIGCIALSLVGGVIVRPKQTRIKEGKNNVTAKLRRQLGKRT